MSDILERLAAATDDVHGGRHDHGIGHYWNLCEEAEDEIRALRKRVEELEGGEVRWVVMSPWNDYASCPRETSADAIEEFTGGKLDLRWVDQERRGYRIVRVRVTEIPEEEADE